MTSEITNWRKSMRSGNTANCVEVGSAEGIVGVRDSKDRQGPVLAVAPAAWTSFLTRLVGDTVSR